MDFKAVLSVLGVTLITNISIIHEAIALPSGGCFSNNDYYCWTGEGTDNFITNPDNWFTNSVFNTPDITPPIGSTLVFGSGTATNDGANELSGMMFVDTGMFVDGSQFVFKQDVYLPNILNWGLGSNELATDVLFKTDGWGYIKAQGVSTSEVGGTLTVSGNVIAQGNLSLSSDYSSQINITGNVEAGDLETYVDRTSSIIFTGNINVNNLTTRQSTYEYGITPVQHDIKGALTVSNELLIYDYARLYFSGENGALVNAPVEGIAGFSNSELVLDNSQVVNNNRIHDSVDINLGKLIVKGNASQSVAETFNNLVGDIEIESAGRSVALTFNSVNGGADYEVNGPGVLGGTGADDHHIFITNAPTLTNGLTGGTLNGREFVTYDATVGVRSATNATSLVGADASSNVLLSGTSESNDSTINLNSLAIDDSNITGSGTLVLTHGRLLSSGTGTNNIENLVVVSSITGNTETVLNGGFAGLSSVRGNIVVNADSSVGADSLFLSSGSVLTLGVDNALFESSGLENSVDIFAGSNTAALDIGSTTQTFRVIDSGFSYVGLDLIGSSGSVFVDDATVDQVEINLTATNTVSVRNLTSNGTITALTGDVTVTSSAAGNITANNININGATVTGDLNATGSININNGSTVDSNIVNNGGITVSGSTVNGEISGAGNLEATGSKTVLTADNTYTGNTSVLSNGILQVGQSGIGSISSNVTLSPNGTLIVNGTVNGDIFNDSGLIAGNGVINGNVTSQGGAVGPGNSPGILEINGDLTLDSSSSLLMEITGLGLGEYDQLFVSGALTFESGSVFDLSFTEGFALSQGESLDLFSATTTVGLDFVAFTFSGIETGFMYETMLSEEGGLSLIALNDFVSTTAPSVVPVPGAIWLFGSGLIGLIGFARRKKA